MSLDNFTLHPQLAADTLLIGDLPICRVLLMNNRTFPWLILVPRKNNLQEIFDLSKADYILAMEEIKQVSEAFRRVTKADKINIAALGNMVPQLHIHIIARFKNDAAWPDPVWNCAVKTQPYFAGDIPNKLFEIRTAINITNL